MRAKLMRVISLSLLLLMSPLKAMEVNQNTQGSTIRKGHFITFEGGEGAGKSTQTKLLVDYLLSKGQDVVQTREPGGTEGAEAIRSLLVSGDVNRWTPKTEALLMVAARVDHWTKVIRPALDQGKWVICDRFFDSTYAYQGYGHGVNLLTLQNLHEDFLPDSTPDRTYIFDIDPRVGIKRALSRRGGEDRFEKMDLSFHERLRQGYLDIASANPKRCLVLEAMGMKTEIHQKIVEDVEWFLS